MRECVRGRVCVDFFSFLFLVDVHVCTCPFWVYVVNLSCLGEHFCYQYTCIPFPPGLWTYLDILLFFGFIKSCILLNTSPVSVGSTTLVRHQIIINYFLTYLIIYDSFSPHFATLLGFWFASGGFVWFSTQYRSYSTRVIYHWVDTF